ncbi:MAG: hypothetical protein H6828_05015 [Planctomycetes bacterium]|nr:hypothetical protein [Planctomycetota bacterium]
MLAMRSAWWMLRRLGTGPESWLLFLGSAALWPILVSQSPLFAVLSTTDAGTLAVGCGWLGTLLGTLLAVRTLGRHQWILERGAGGATLVAQLAATLAAGLLGLGATWIAPLLFARELDAAWGALLAAGAVLVLHQGLLAACLLQLRLRPSTASLAFLLLVWIVPSLAAARGGGLGELASLLDSQAGADHAHELSLHGCAQALQPIAVLGLVLWLLASSPRLRAPLPTR